MTLPKTKSCPRCKKTKAIDQFGTRMMDGIKRPQSYCVSCRGLKPKSHRKLPQKGIRIHNANKISKNGGKKK